MSRSDDRKPTETKVKMVFSAPKFQFCAVAVHIIPDNFSSWHKMVSSMQCLRACLHGCRPQVDEVTFGGLPHLSRKRDQIKMRDYMDRRVTPLKWVTSSTWGPPSPSKQWSLGQTSSVLDKIGCFPNKLSAGYRGINQQIVESTMHFLSIGPVMWGTN